MITKDCLKISGDRNGDEKERERPSKWIQRETKNRHGLAYCRMEWKQLLLCNNVPFYAGSITALIQVIKDPLRFHSECSSMHD